MLKFLCLCIASLPQLLSVQQLLGFNMQLEWYQHTMCELCQRQCQDQLSAIFQLSFAQLS